MKTRKDRTFCNENPSGYRRLLPAHETIRAQWHDYRESDYFVTVCTQNRVHYFGEVYNGQMELTAVGEYLTAEIENVSDHYPYVEIPVYVIMPDHIHLIVAIHPRSRDAIHRVREPDNRVQAGGITGNKNPMLNESLATVMRGLKARVTQFARQNNIPFKWQPRYHDRIIRNRNEKIRITKYIEQNPTKWKSL